MSPCRWNEETTFHEMLSYLGPETTRGWKERDPPGARLRAARCLFGLYTVVACLYSQLPRRYARERAVAWPGKTGCGGVREWLYWTWEPP
jgi:hypothetical protein